MNARGTTTKSSHLQPMRFVPMRLTSKYVYREPKGKRVLVSAVHMFTSPRGRQYTVEQASDFVHTKMACPCAWEAIIH
eukprot:scaffold531280_cov17-Prasinocladus_malaysianus.AAC.1